MSIKNDLRTLWKKEQASGMPDAKALLDKATRLRQLFRMKLIIQSITLSIILAVMVIVGLQIGQRAWTTILGLGLMIAGILAYLITASQLLPMLFKREMGTDSQEYVRQLIRIQRKNQFIQRIMTDIYFILLTAGLYLYLIQSALMLNLIWAILLYLLPSIGLATTWAYSKRKELSKNASTLNETVQQLEKLNAQLFNNE